MIFRRLLPLFFAALLPLVAANKLEKYHAAVADYEARRYAQAVELFSQFVKENPYEPEVRKAWFYMTNALAEQGNCHESLARANITLDRYPVHPDKSELLVISAECLYRVNAHTRAEKTLSGLRRVEEMPSLAYRAERLRGMIAYDARGYARAEKHYRAALQHAARLGIEDTTLLRVNADLGRIYATDSLRTEEAVAYLSRAVALAEKFEPGQARSLKTLLRRLSLRRIDKLNGLDDNSIADIRVDGDDVYVATWGGGLVRYTRSQDKLAKIPLPSPQLRGLYADFEEIFVASYDGIFRISKKTGTTESINDAKGTLRLGQKIIKDDRFIYCSTLSRGLIQYDSIKRGVITLGKDSWVKSDQVYAIDADLEYVAVGTLDQGALIHHKASGETIQITKGENDLRSENVKAVLLDGRYVYIAAHNDGVYAYDLQQKKLRRLEAEIPFPSALARRENEIFIGTSGQGVRVLDRNTGRLERITAVEGLSSNEVQILRVEGEFLWIGYLEHGIDVLYRPSKKD
ncbi:MAG TPA: tetratricopeptide repeat protein [Turneriella sp.]|nr:tetratricopeptide repeat protein [Turneriella sp.]